MGFAEDELRNVFVRKTCTYVRFIVRLIQIYILKVHKNLSVY